MNTEDLLTDKEMLEVAEAYVKALSKEFNQELLVDIHRGITKKNYGNVYHWNEKKYVLNTDLVYHGIFAPFLVENERRRVVQFGSSRSLDGWLESYENGTFVGALDSFWYMDENRFASE